MDINPSITNIMSTKELILSNCGAGEDSWESLGQQGDQNQSILKKIHWQDWCWSWSSNTLETWWEEPTAWKSPWCWGKLRAGGEEGERAWNGWMASLTQRTWVWANSVGYWRTGKPHVLQSMGSQRVGHNLVTENQQDKMISVQIYVHLRKMNSMLLLFYICLFPSELKLRVL